MAIGVKPVLAGAALAVATLLYSSALTAQQPAGATLLVNGSLEQGPDPGSYANLASGQTAINGWVVTGEGIDYVGKLWAASDGARSVDLDGSASSRTTPPYCRGGLAQTFASTPGKSYVVSLDLAGNVFAGPPSKPMRVSAAGQSTDFEFPIAGKSRGNMGWVRKSWTFTANAATTTLEISSLTTSPNTGFGAAIDNIAVVQLNPGAPQTTQSQTPPAPQTAQKQTQAAPQTAQKQTPAASAQPFQVDAVYQCSGGLSFKVIACAGSGDADACDVQSYVLGLPYQRGQSPRQQVLMLVPRCHLQTAQEAQAEVRARQSVASAPAASPAAGPGIKVGDKVEINTAFGWMDAQVLAINGNSYQVRAQSGAEVWKTYPDELRRVGPLNDYDKAQGLYELGEHVQVLLEGGWADGKIMTVLGQEYQVELPGNRMAWATAAQLRRPSK